jgi:hypothetical protein
MEIEERMGAAGTQVIWEERPRRWPWIAGGFALEFAALGVIAGVMAHESRREDALGEITKYSLRLAWHDVIHRRSLVLLMVACALVYMAGATLIAKPFVSTRWRLFLLVPVAALASLAVFGVAALLVWILVASEGKILDGADFGWDLSGDRGRKRRPHLDDVDTR